MDVILYEGFAKTNQQYKTKKLFIYYQKLQKENQQILTFHLINRLNHGGLSWHYRNWLMEY